MFLVIVATSWDTFFAYFNPDNFVIWSNNHNFKIFLQVSPINVKKALFYQIKKSINDYTLNYITFFNVWSLKWWLNSNKFYTNFGFM